MRKNLYYYVAFGKSYFGKATTDILTAEILLSKAKLTMPGLDWQIVTYPA